MQGVSGYRCHTLADWLHAVDAAPRLNRKRIAQRAQAVYSLAAIGPQYARVFEQIADLGKAGWRTPQRGEPSNHARPLATYGAL